MFSNTVSSSFTATIKNLTGGQIISQNGSAIRTLNGNTTIVNAGLVQSNVGTAITMGNGNDSLCKPDRPSSAPRMAALATIP